MTTAVCIVESSNRESSSRDMLSNNVDLYRVDLILLHKYDAIWSKASFQSPDHPKRFSFSIDHFVVVHGSSSGSSSLMTLEYIHVAKITHTQSGYWMQNKTDRVTFWFIINVSYFVSWADHNRFPFIAPAHSPHGRISISICENQTTITGPRWLHGCPWTWTSVYESSSA